ncbi:MAG TPA: BTAD domain-containing putative transcriptional regulator, partial [Thermoanaerobaculaceae bacterium]|nr:BTAD domain-containing putative transcriptional regulator [Thermoanaerobaculaceae bacterium]
MEAGDTTRRPGPETDAPAGRAPDGLVLRFLGGCEIAVAGATVRLESTKTTGLLAFLAVAGGTHSRPKLAGTFWPDLAEDRAAAALRRALWDQRRRLTPADGDSPLQVTRGTVAFDPGPGCASDVERFRRELAGSGPLASRFPGDAGVERLERAVALYRGDLLDGFFVDGAPGFEDWLLAERERLRMAAIQALQLLVGRLREAGETLRALGHARHLLAVDPWLEEAHRAVADLLASSGQLGAALQQLQTCRRVLAEELGAAPTIKTQELERRLRAQARPSPGAGTATAGAGAGSAPVAVRQNLPLPTTPFVGRQRELAEIAQRLGDPGCRLLTLLGPGGIGKTRLALQAAFQALGGGEQPRVPFPDGIVFVPASETQPAGVLAEQIARALDLAPGGFPDLPAQVCAFLGGRRVLLVLDGFEHRLADAGLLSAILAAAPEVKLLVTSRERLRLDGEWVLELAGLDLPGRDGARGSNRSPAVQLYLRAARRATLDFRADAAALAAIAAVCRLVDGMPLAIEMAAAWTNVMTPA